MEQKQSVVLKLESIVKRAKANYIKLLENPEFTYRDFLEVGGWHMLDTYKETLSVLENLESGIDVEEFASVAEMIEKEYKQRWRVHD